jgi:hypothetical protein
MFDPIRTMILMPRSTTIYSCLSFLLAINYLAFRAEIFEKEYEQNHPSSSMALAFSPSSVNWETFDKDNAPKAFVLDARERIQVIGSVNPQFCQLVPLTVPLHVVRDKSPPGSSV